MDANRWPAANGDANPNESGSEEGSAESDKEWNRDQGGQIKDREVTDAGSASKSEDPSPLQDDEDGVGSTDRG